MNKPSRPKGQSSTNTPYHYSELDNGIHQIVLNESSRQAVDGWIATLEDIYTDIQPDDLVRTLVDIRAGIQPLGYTMKSMREFIKTHPQPPKTRTAFYHKSDVLMVAVTGLVNTLISRGKDTVKFFSNDQYEEAIQWLLLDN